MCHMFGVVKNKDHVRQEGQSDATFLIGADGRPRNGAARRCPAIEEVLAAVRSLKQPA